MPDEVVVTRTDSDGVAVIELNRPARKNALIAPMFDLLAEHFAAVADDSSVGAVLLCGAGGSFCSGLDLDAYTQDPPPEWLPAATDSLRRAHVAIARCPVPLVVALERYAINGGAAFALAADFLVVGDESWLQVGEVRQGIPAPMNVAWLAARYPASTVLRVVLSGDRIGAAELFRMNVAHEVAPESEVRSAAEGLATRLAESPGQASRALKRAILDLSGMGEPEAWFDRTQELLPFAQGFSPKKQEG